MSTPTDRAMSPEELRAARLAKVRADYAKDEEERQRLEEDLEIERGELREKLKSEIGKEGRDFAIFTNSGRVFAVKRVDALVMKTWTETCASVPAGKSFTMPQVLAFTEPGIVYPSASEFRRLVLGDEKAPGFEGIALDAAAAINVLHGKLKGEGSGKP